MTIILVLQVNFDNWNNLEIMALSTSSILGLFDLYTCSIYCGL